MTAYQIFAFVIFFVLIAFFGMLMVLETILAPLSFAKLVRAATGFDFKPLMQKDEQTKKAFRSFVLPAWKTEGTPSALMAGASPR